MPSDLGGARQVGEREKIIPRMGKGALIPRYVLLDNVKAAASALSIPSLADPVSMVRCVEMVDMAKSGASYITIQHPDSHTSLWCGVRRYRAKSLGLVS